jgi:hypothetical protein
MFSRHFTEAVSEAFKGRERRIAGDKQAWVRGVPRARKSRVSGAIITFHRWLGDTLLHCAARGGMRPLILLALLTPSARSCFDETRGGCYTAGFVDNLSRALESTGQLGAHEVVGRDEALRDVRQDPLRFVQCREVPEQRLPLQ